MHRQRELSSHVMHGRALLRQALSAAAALCLALVMALAPARTARADDASLTLVMEYTAGGKTTQIDGVTATVYQVASLDEAINHYTLLDGFSSLNVDFDQGMDASTMASVAAKAAGIASKAGAAGTSATSDSKGIAAFGTLPKGVYLVVQSGKSGTAESYDDYPPFLISVPQLTEDDIIYDVLAYPKPEPAKNPGTPTKPKTPKTTPRLPQTSDLLNPQLWAGLLAFGAACAITGVIVRRRENGK